MKSKQPQKAEQMPRQPIVVVMGHIDHGKSTLLDYIRKTNVAKSEKGGITQHLSAYEVSQKDETGTDRKITFLDTPGHEAFQKMRLHGAEVADIAILIVSAEEGVKEQTLEALHTIKKAGLPYIVALNKIDRPNADVERTKQSLLEKEVYLEGFGGDIPWIALSAKEGTGVPELLDTLLLIADLEELKGSTDVDAEGIVIEAHLDQRKGISATLVIKEGTLKSGMYVVSGTHLSPVRIFEDFQGKAIKEAGLGSPVQVVGWNTLPQTGATFSSFPTKKEAEQALLQSGDLIEKETTPKKEETEEKTIIPIVLKADVAGSLDAVKHELEKLNSEQILIKVVQQGVGVVSENDIKAASGTDGVLVLGFHTSVDKVAQDLADRTDVTVETFDVIYKLSEWLEAYISKQKPEDESQKIVGSARILKCFGKTKNKQVVGGRVESGSIHAKQPFKILRQETEIGHGTFLNLQQQKANVTEISESNEFGAQIESQIEVLANDILEVHKK